MSFCYQERTEEVSKDQTATMPKRPSKELVSYDISDFFLFYVSGKLILIISTYIIFRINENLLKMLGLNQLHPKRHVVIQEGKHLRLKCWHLDNPALRNRTKEVLEKQAVGPENKCIHLKR